VLRRPQDERLDDEMAAHLDELTRQHQSRGLRVEAARLAARRDFGAATRVREEYREQRGGVWIDTLQQDVHHAVRALRRAPGFAAASVLTLALGLGATTAIFSVVNALMLRPLPFPEPERLVRIVAAQEAPDGSVDRRPLNLGPRDLPSLIRESEVLKEAGVVTLSLAHWPGHEPRWSGVAATASTLTMTGVQPVLGRTFSAADEEDGAPGAMVLSYRSWQVHFGGRTDVVGQSVRLEPALALGGPARAREYAVVGVMPEGFQFPPGGESNYWIPMATTGQGIVIARLRAGITLEAATGPVSRALAVIRPAPPAGRVPSYEVTTIQSDLVRTVRPALLVLMGAVGFLLLLACVNVANLMLARSLARERETVLRVALGAGRGRLARAAMTESLVLAVLAVGPALACAMLGIRALRWLAAASGRIDLGQRESLVPMLDAVSVDWRVLVFVGGIALTAVVLVGLVPALRRVDRLALTLQRSGAAVSEPAIGHTRARNVLVVAEVALAMVLLVGGGLLATSFVTLLQVDPGYRVEQVMTFQVSLPLTRYPLPRVQEFAEALDARLTVTPGVAGAAYANQLPLVQLVDTLPFGRTPDAKRERGGIGGDVRFVSHDYLSTMGVPVVAGRGLDTGDGTAQPRVMLINKALADRVFGGVKAVGQRVFLWREDTPTTIVGVVGDVRQFGLNQAPEPQIFMDVRQWREGLSPLFPIGPYFAVRMTGDDGDVMRAVAGLVRDAEPEAVLFNVAPMREVVSMTVSQPRFYMVLLVAFAIVGVVLAVIGIYGVLSFTVMRRTREIGIRMALGARRQEVLGLVLQQTAIVTITGVVLGLAGAASVTRYLQSLLFDMEPLDIWVFTGTSVLFVLVALAASAVPARRATRIDPLVALRTE
jgi:putative ABC transport system permease protein